MFGFVIVKQKKLDLLENRFDVLASHIWNNAGFVDEKGVLSNSKDGLENETRRQHWSLYHKLTREISQLFRSL